jgi:hypothetical protein
VYTTEPDFNGREYEELFWVIYIIHNVIVVIMFLNLVIAIMSETFEKVQETQEATKLREFASIIKENEFVVSRNALFGNTKYIVIIEPVKSVEDVEGDWLGRLQELKKKLKFHVTKNHKNLASHSLKLHQAVEVSVISKMKPLEDRINQTTENIETRILRAMESTQTASEQLRALINK